MILSCVNAFVRDLPCCNNQHGKSFFHGIKIIDGKRTFCYPFPVNIWISEKKLKFEWEGVEKHYRLSQFTTQSEQQLQDIISSCASGIYQQRLKREYVSYTVESGDQNTFLCPKGANEIYQNINMYDVYVNGQMVSQGTGELQYVLNGGDVFFTQAIPDVTPEDNYIVEIYYWLKY